MSKIPITIGIVGHKDAVVTDEHKNKLIQILNEVSVQYPNSPIRLFSQLALGADTEVAKLYVEYSEKHNIDFKLIVPLPFNKDYFEKTQFKAKEELTMFHDLLSKNERTFELNHLSEETKKALDIDPNSNIDDLTECYQMGGEFVADSSIILIALWEQVDNKLEGGSASIVNYKIEESYKGGKGDSSLFDNYGSLISMPCNRGQNQLVLDLKQDYLNTLLEDTSIKKALDKIEELNTSLFQIESSTLSQSSDYLYTEKSSLSSENKKLQSIYSLVDSQANYNQKKYNKLLKGFFILGFIVLCSFESYKHLGLSNSLFFSTVFLLISAYMIYKVSSKWKNHKKYIEDRVLAEALRIQFFWNISKLRLSVSDYLLSIHKKENDWLKHILYAVYGCCYPSENSKKVSADKLKSNWINDQKEYFIKKVDQLENKEKQNHLISNVSFSLGLVLLLLIFLLNMKDHHHPWLHPLIVIDSIAFGVFALCKAYFEKKGYEQTKTQYQLMENIYTTSSKKIEEIMTSSTGNQSEEIEHILFLTGKEALVENGNWYMIYKDKDPEVEGIG